MPGDDLYDWPCVIKHETDKALLGIDFETGEELWIPFSQIEKIDRSKTSEVAVVHMSQWIARKKGLCKS